MKRIYIASPLSAKTVEGVGENLTYARECMLDSFSRGEAPYVPHLLYPQVLNDQSPDERKMGMEAGKVWMHVAEKFVLYIDRGVSSGMRSELAFWDDTALIISKYSVEVRMLRGTPPLLEEFLKSEGLSY